MPSSKLILLFLFIGGGMAALLLARREFSQDSLDPNMRAQHQLGALQMIIERFALDTGRYPTETEGMTALTARPYAMTSQQWRGPYLEMTTGNPLRDPWNRPFRYRVLENGRGMAYTLGADDAPGGVGENRDVMGVSEIMRKANALEKRSGSAMGVLRE